MVHKPSTHARASAYEHARVSCCLSFVLLIYLHEVFLDCLLTQSISTCAHLVLVFFSSSLTGLFVVYVILLPRERQLDKLLAQHFMDFFKYIASHRPRNTYVIEMPVAKMKGTGRYA